MQRPDRRRLYVQRPDGHTWTRRRGHIPQRLQARHQVRPARRPAADTPHRDAGPPACPQKQPDMDRHLSRGTGRTCGRTRGHGARHAPVPSRRHRQDLRTSAAPARHGFPQGGLCLRAGTVCRPGFNLRHIQLQPRHALSLRFLRRGHRHHTHVQHRDAAVRGEGGRGRDTVGPRFGRHRRRVAARHPRHGHGAVLR